MERQGLDLGTADISAWRVLWCVCGCVYRECGPTHCRTFSISGFYPLDASSTAPLMATKHVSRMSPGRKIHPRSRTSGLEALSTFFGRAFLTELV